LRAIRWSELLKKSCFLIKHFSFGNEKLILVDEKIWKLALKLNEVKNLKFISMPVLDKLLASRQESFTFWLKLEWERLKYDYMDTLSKYIKMK